MVLWFMVFTHGAILILRTLITESGGPVFVFVKRAGIAVFPAAAKR